MAIAVPVIIPVVPDDPVVSVAFASSDKTYPVRTEHGGPVNVRSGPGLGFSVVDHVNNGEKVKIHCTRVDGSGTVWDDISGNGRFVSDRYVKTGQTAPVAPPCDGPAPAGPGGPSPAAADHADAQPAAPDPAPKTYPVRTEHGGPVNVRSGPGLGFSVVDHVNNGEKVKIHCTRVDGSGTVWDDISGNGRFVSDRYVKTGQTAPVAPPCDGPAPAGPGGPSPAAADHADALQAPADPGPSPALADPKVLITVEEDPNDQGGCSVGGPFGGLCKLGGIFHRGIHWSSEKIMDVVKPCAAGAGTAALSNMIVATAAGTGRWELLVAAAAVGCVMGILKGDGLVPVPPLPGR